MLQIKPEVCVFFDSSIMILITLNIMCHQNQKCVYIFRQQQHDSFTLNFMCRQYFTSDGCMKSYSKVSNGQEVNFSEEQIQYSDALAEMSQGNWEGCLRSDIYTPEIMGLIDRFQPDFTAPSGESLRQVEFRMIHFLNETVLGLHEKLRLVLSSPHQNDSQAFAQHNSHALTNSIHDQDGSSLHQNQWDLLNRHRPAFSRKKSGKSRLQIVTTTGGDEIEDDIPSSNTNHQSSLHNSSFSSFSPPSSSVSCIGLFTHSVPIKCLLTGLLGCSPQMSHKFCVEDSSVTVLQHSLRTGWQIKKLNDTAHLRLLQLREAVLRAILIFGIGLDYKFRLVVDIQQLTRFDAFLL